MIKEEVKVYNYWFCPTFTNRNFNYAFGICYRYIAPEQVPVQYGGLSREGDQEFSIADPVTELVIKPSTKHTVEIPVSEVRPCQLVNIGGDP